MNVSIRSRIGLGVVVAGALIAFGAARIEHASVAAPRAVDPNPTAAGQIASFATSPAAGAVVDSETGGTFADRFASRSGLDQSKLRRFALGDRSGFSIVAAPTATGGICYVNSLAAGSCIDSFARGAGLMILSGEVFKLDHVIVAGLVPDGTVQVTVNTRTGSYSGVVRNNVYRIDLPAKAATADVTSYATTAADGSVRTETLGPISTTAPPMPSESSSLTAAPGGPVALAGGVVQFWWYSSGNFYKCHKDPPGGMFYWMECTSPGFAPRSWIQQTSTTVETHDLRYYNSSWAQAAQIVVPSTTYAALWQGHGYAVTDGRYYGHDGHNDDTVHTTTN